VALVATVRVGARTTSVGTNRTPTTWRLVDSGRPAGRVPVAAAAPLSTADSRDRLLPRVAVGAGRGRRGARAKSIARPTALKMFIVDREKDKHRQVHNYTAARLQTAGRAR